MPRFEREEAPDRSATSLGTATEGLRQTVEEKLHEIVEAAEARAHEIEDRALEQALEVEQDSERKAAELFQSSFERAERLLVAIDAFERDLSGAVRALRRKGMELADQLDAAEMRDAAAESETGTAEIAATGELEAAAESAREEEPDSTDPREGVRRRILDLFLAGRPRTDAERLLRQIENGGRYDDLLDEIYEPRAETQQGSRRRRGGRRRRRPGS